jgi:transcriptional regulator of acetoin/glycerol metabolism
MQPTNYPIRRDVLKQFWYAFTKTGQVEPVNGQEPDPVVLRSWQRCAPRLAPRQSPRLATLQEPALQKTLKVHEDLMMLARPFVEDIYQFLQGAYCAIIVTDGAGCVLDIEGEHSILSHSQEPVTTRGRSLVNQRISDGANSSPLQRGTIWSEGSMGTNAFGLALITAMPVQVVGAEHYHEFFHQTASSAAPIHDVNGRIVGVIGILEPISAVSRHSLSLVMAAAQAINNQFQADMYLQEANHRLTEVKAILELIHEGVVTWDANDKLNQINALASRTLKLNPSSVLGRPYQEILQFPPELQKAIDNHQELTDVEAALTADGYTVDCLISLMPISYGEAVPAGYIAILRPIEQVRRLVHQQVGTKAMLALDDMPIQSAAMRSVMRQARTAARGTAPVLLRGEGGVGKNHLARAIHNDSERGSKPFLAINCQAIPHELMISEILGYDQGSGPDGRPSKFELASGGTLMFDHIDGLSLEMQAALLHVIETGHVMRLGSARPIPVDVRVIAATSLPLEKLIKEDQFMSHLYYRFGVFNITLPPLRERREDIPLLAERFLARISERDGVAAWIDDEATAVIKRYPWPGNVRELESTLERALHHSYDNTIHVTDLPDTIRSGRVVVGDSPHPEPVLTTAEAEREAIIRAGLACQGQVTEMAQHLGIGRTTLWRKMKRYKLTPEQFRQ